MACHRRALSLRPDYAQAHLNLGNALQFQGRYAEALACYRFMHLYEAGAWTAVFRTYDRDFNLINASDAFPSNPGAPLYVQTVPSSDTGYSLDLTRSAGFNELLIRALTVEARHRAVVDHADPPVMDKKQQPRDAAARQHAADFPQPVAQWTAERHSDRPSQLHRG